MRAQVMRRAWEIYRTLVGNRIAKLSAALKQAWREVKNTVEKIKFSGYAKVAKMENPYDDECCFLYFKKWEKHGKCRIYINDYKKRTIGYIENGAVVINNRQGSTEDQVEYALNKFFATYAM